MKDAAMHETNNAIGVQFIGQTQRVVAGRVNTSRDGLDGETTDVTDNAVQAVAEYVINGFDGALEVEYDGGITYQVQVSKIGPTHSDGARHGLHPGGVIASHE